MIKDLACLMPPNSFSVEAYRILLLKIVKTGRCFCSFTDPHDQGVLLRLDVDYDPRWALELALVNQKMGAHATFFVLVGSPLYNLFHTANSEAIGIIRDAGQAIGLHFFHTEPDLDVARLRREFDLLRLVAPDAEPVVAWHNPDDDLRDLNEAAQRAGFVSAYSEQFFGPNIYISDSNCRNRPMDIAQFVEMAMAPLVHVLLHPLNWVMGGNSMVEVIRRTFRSKLDHLAFCFTQNRV